jgi:hypothetical protein
MLASRGSRGRTSTSGLTSSNVGGHNLGNIQSIRDLAIRSRACRRQTSHWDYLGVARHSGVIRFAVLPVDCNSGYEWRWTATVADGIWWIPHLCPSFMTQYRNSRSGASGAQSHFGPFTTSITSGCAHLPRFCATVRVLMDIIWRFRRLDPGRIGGPIAPVARYSGGWTRHHRALQRANCCG